MQGALATDSPTTPQSPSDNRILPPLLLSATLPLGRLTYLQIQEKYKQELSIMAEREVQIKALEMKVRDLRATFEVESQEEFAALQPIMEQLNGQIFAFQKELVDRLDALKASQVADLEAQIHILKQENTYATSVLAPIWRLPVGILAEVFSLSIHSHAQSPLQLMLVCRSWRSVILGMLHWSTIHLSTSTNQPSNTGSTAEQTKAIPLDVDINACTGALKVVDGGEVMRSARLEMVAKEVKRWRTLAITSFPHKPDIDACPSRVKPAFTFNGPMDGLQSFKIKSTCENSALLDQLLALITTLYMLMFSQYTTLPYIPLIHESRLTQPHYNSKVLTRDMGVGPIDGGRG